jgi:hypothetical protein
MKRYGVEGRDIHSWLDEPSREYAGSHRQFRHDTETVRLVGELFGKTYGKNLAENIALDHIMVDHEQEIKNRNPSIVVNPENKEIPSIPCSYCNTLLKPSDQLCPKCGASRTKIVEKFNRAYEIEKIKLQEERKNLKKEMKRELFLKSLTPDERLHSLRVNPRDPVALRMVEEDFSNHPELNAKFQQDMENRIRAKRRKPYIKLFAFVFFVTLPAIWLWGILPPISLLWFMIGSAFVLAG